MKKSMLWFFIFGATVVFVLVFANAYNVSQKAGREKEQIFKAAKTAVKNYLQTPLAPRVTFTSTPISYSENGCVVGCYIDLPEASGEKRRTWLEVLLQRDGLESDWKGTIIKCVSNQPIIKENLKPAPWDLFKSIKKLRRINYNEKNYNMRHLDR